MSDLAALFLDVDEWDDNRDLIAKYIPSFRESGKTLAEWLAVWPEEQVAADPWLLYGQGICLMPRNPGAAFSFFEKAFRLFKDQGIAEGIFQTWSCIVEAIIRERRDFHPLDTWLAELEAVTKGHPDFPSREIELRVAIGSFMCLMLRAPDQPALKKGREKVAGLLKEADIADRLTICLLLTCYNSWTGNYQEVAPLIEALRADVAQSQSTPLLRAELELIEAVHCCFSGEHDRCREAIAQGMEIAKQNGLPEVTCFLLFCRTENALIDGGEEIGDAALAALRGKKSTPLEHIYYCLFSAWQALRAGKTNAAHDCLRACEKAVDELGSFHHESLWHMGMAQVRFARVEVYKAMDSLNIAFAAARKIQGLLGMYAGLLLYARFYFALGENMFGVFSLQQAMITGREHGLTHFPWWQPEVMADLCAKALENDFEPHFVWELISRRNLTPRMRSWPLRIRTLGSFEINLHDAPIGNGQKKTLELLKMLISFGGHDVPVERLAIALWPDADGDYARHSLETTLYRLRKLLGSAKVLLCRQGRLSIDLRYCWIDVVAFERLCLANEKLSHENRIAQQERELVPLWEKAFGLYRGHFLSTERELAWTIPLRERLRAGFQNIIMMAGGYWEQQGAWEKAIAWYRRGIEVDGSVEEFHQRLMLCCHNNGETTEAIMIYRRLRTMLARRFDLAPSQKTEVIYRGIIRKNSSRPKA